MNLNQILLVDTVTNNYSKLPALVHLAAILLFKFSEILINNILHLPYALNWNHCSGRYL